MEKEKKYKLVLGEDTPGVYAIALTPNPANERRAVMMNSDGEPKPQVFKLASEAKRTFTAPLLIPGQEIERKGKDGKKYWITATPELIEQAAKKFAAGGYNNNINNNHKEMHEQLSIFESWIVRNEENDTAYGGYGFSKEDAPVGSWVGTIDASRNDKVWAQMQRGEYYGLSIEGLFDLIEVEEEKEETISLSAETSDTLFDLSALALESLLQDESKSDFDKISAIQNFMQNSDFVK